MQGNKPPLGVTIGAKTEIHRQRFVFAFLQNNILSRVLICFKMQKDQPKTKIPRSFELCAPAVYAHGREVQLVLGLKEQHFGPDFQDGRRVDGHSDGEEGQLRVAAGPIVPQRPLTMEVLQSALETQSLEWISFQKRCE